MQSPAERGVVGARLFFHQHDGVELVRARAAVFFRHRAAQEPVRAGLLPDVLVDVALVLPALVVRRDFRFQEAPDAVAERLVLGTEKGPGDHCGELARLIDG
jgi:hypothetical protein